MKQLNNKKERGITLIALVVTIIVLIILAGISINLIFGTNGIINKAKSSKTLTEQASLNEQIALGEIDKELEKYIEGLPENTKDNPQVAGTEVKIPEGWYTTTPAYVSTEDGSIVKKSVKVASVTAVATGNGETVPVPKDFYYVGGTKDTGVVISDSYDDSYEKNKKDMTSHEDAINLKGNQFVWIPCTAAEYIKSNWSNGSQGNVSGKSNCYWGTEINSLELVQIKKYGGFYVSRYEAGLPQGTKEFENSINYISNIYNSIEGVPQSKAGISPWNFIDWNNSQIKARKMYEGKSNVASGLITGTQWDVMLNKIGSLKDESGNTRYSLTNSASWGNYYTGDTNGFTFRGKVSQYSSNKQYAFTTPTSTTKLNSTYYLLQTGASEHNLTYNLYDVAGNLWEWTEESAAFYNSIGTLVTNRVLRGGSFGNVSSDDPVCFRAGNYAATLTYSHGGFRVVLYMK